MRTRELPPRLSKEDRGEVTRARAMLVNGGNDSASWPFPHLSSAPPSTVAMDRHPRVDLRDFAESQSTCATETDTQKRDRARSERVKSRTSA